MNCAICHQPMKFIQAGISKTTGQPYPAFYACQDRTHKQPRAPQTPVQQFNQSLDQNTQDTKWQKIRIEKEENIRWCNAINNAVLLVAHGITEKGNLQATADYIYRLEPSQTHKTAPSNRVNTVQPQDDIQEQMPQNTQSSEEVNVEEIPF